MAGGTLPDGSPELFPGQVLEGGRVRGGALGQEGADSEAVGVLPMPIPPRDVWSQGVFRLCYMQHGHGLGFGWRDVMDLDAGDREPLLELLSEQLHEDAKAMKGT